MCVTIPDFEGVRLEDLDSADELLERLKGKRVCVEPTKYGDEVLIK